MDNQAEARARMVDEQIASRGVVDARVLEAMRAVPRHEFVEHPDRFVAYSDRALPIGQGQTISQPYMVAAMSEALALPGQGRVLEIGTGSGYQAAILATLAREVISVERHEALASRARERLHRLGYRNVRVMVGDGSLGWAESAPYDGIIVTAGAPAVPDALRQQLVDGGRLVIPVGNEYLQHLLIINRRGDAFDEQRGEACAFVPLVGDQAWPEKPQ
jgi:protein-L-isoaspartate(D-aspartate) O-methyltransferase